MNKYNIITELKRVEDKQSLLLIKKLSERSGFFCNEDKLIFMDRDITHLQNEIIETEYLKLETHVKIKGVKNFQTFRDDYYNLIIFKAEISNDNIYDFINLCNIYAQNIDELVFKEFFYSLISIFQLPSEKKYINAIGLYGELKLMQYFAKKYKIDLSVFWHRKGPLSLYDFSIKNHYIEVKSNANGTEIATIKHKQIFDVADGFLAFVSANINDVGETIEEVISSMQDDRYFFDNLNFNINITKELKRISNDDYKEKRFKLKRIGMYSTEAINPFLTMPDGVSDLIYKLDLSDYEEIKNEEEVAALFE